jgi:hypothetical protein
MIEKIALAQADMDGRIKVSDLRKTEQSLEWRGGTRSKTPTHRGVAGGSIESEQAIFPKSRIRAG